MGVDLTLMPMERAGAWFTQDVLTVERRGNLWGQIKALPLFLAPEPVWCHLAKTKDGDSTFGELSADPYGNPLMWTMAGDLLSLRKTLAIQDNTRNRAVWAYLAELTPNWPVVLYWH